jgi:hypothetical protein
VAQAVVEHLARLQTSFACWRNRLGFSEAFRIARSESGFPTFQHVLELENDRKTAERRLASIPAAPALREEMVDFILRHREFPTALQRSMAERLYLEGLSEGAVFSPHILPRTVRVSVNPKTRRPYYIVHWGSFDGSADLPLVYMAVLEDSSDRMVEAIVGPDGKIRPDLDIPLPVEGLLNPDLAHRFDDFAEKNSGYGLSLATIAVNLDKDFDELHPKQLRRVVLGPFYSAGVTTHSSSVNDVLSRVGRQENAWLLTWTIQEIHSQAQTPARRGLWSSQPAREAFFIDTDNLEAARQGVSRFERHALVPHEAYQALYAAGETRRVFGDYQVHIISGGQVISDV